MIASVPRLQDVLQTLQAAVTAAINAAGIAAPVQVALGWPMETQLEPILVSGGYSVTLYPRPNTARSEARYSVRDSLFTITPASSTLIATISDDDITFSGTITAGDVVHAFCGAGEAVYTVQSADTLASIAAAVAAAINALGGVRATVFQTTVTLSSTPFLYCNVSSANGVMAEEVQRVARSIQVSIWSASPALRLQVADAIGSGVGTHDTPLLTLSDGSPMLCLFSAAHSADNLSDQSEILAGIYEEHIVFDVEYGVLKRFPATNIGSVENIVTVNDDASLTLHTGGP